jgi:hypothetical protein
MSVEYARQASEEEDASFRKSSRSGGCDDDDGLDRPLIDTTSGDDGRQSPSSSSPLGGRQNSSSSHQGGGGGRPASKRSDTYYAILGAYCTIMDKLLTPSMAVKLVAEVTPQMRGMLQLFVRPVITAERGGSTVAPEVGGSCLPPFPVGSGLAVRYSHANRHHSQQLRQLWWCVDAFFAGLESGALDSSRLKLRYSDAKETPSTLLEAVQAPLSPFEIKSTTIVVHTGEEDMGDMGRPVLGGGMQIVETATYRAPCSDANGGVAIVSERWKRLGFQGCDPATDFRGSGLMALRQMIQLFDSYPSILRQIFTDSETVEEEAGEGSPNSIPTRRKCCEYPFAAACVNITMHLLMLLSIEPHRTESGDAAAATCITAETARHSYTTLRASFNLCNMITSTNTSGITDDVTLLQKMESNLGEIFMLCVVVMHEHWCFLPPNSRNLLLFNTEVLKKSRQVIEVILREAESIEEVRDRIRRGSAAGKTSPFSGLL